MSRLRWLAIPPILAAVLTAGAARAESDADAGHRLQDVERRIEVDRGRADELRRKSEALAGEVAALRTELVASAKTLQSHEARVSRLERRLRRLHQSEAEKRAALDLRRDELRVTLAALQRLSTYPPIAVFGRPGGARDTVRTALLLRTVVPHLEARAAALSGELAEHIVLRAEIAEQRRKVRSASLALESERRHMASLAARKSRLLRRTDAERQRVQTRIAGLAAEAKTLRELIARLEEQRPAPLPAPDEPPAEEDMRQAHLIQPEGLHTFADGRGQITVPVIGRLSRVFDAAATTGTYNKGVLVATRPGAQVVAPYDGQVVFAGPFRGYGQILIIQHGGGYHTLLAGLRRIDSAVTQWLLAGEPVGVMGTSISGPPTLYLEIRFNGRPIDPLPWLAIDQAKVSG